MKIKSFIIIFVITCIAGVTIAQTDTKDIKLQELWGSGKYFPASIDDFVPMKNDAHYAVLENSFQINEYEYKSGKMTRTIVNFFDVFKNAGIKVKSLDSYVFSDDESKLLVATETESIYRHSSQSNFYTYDIKNNTLSAVDDKKKQRLASFSPDGSKVAYITDNNLYLKDLLTGTTSAITTDGKHNTIINGATDWVYEEEFGFSQAYFWSADGKNIAYYKFDESHVKEFCMMMYGTLYPEEYRYKYPKAGEENAYVSIHIYNVSDKKTLTVDIGTEKDQYIPRIKWTVNPSVLFVYRMNRLQNNLELLSADASTGSTKIVYTEKNNTYIEITDNLVFTDDGKFFFITSEQDGYNHIYRYDMSGKLFNKVTDGPWDVVEIAGYNVADNLLYYTSHQVTPLEVHAYAIEPNGANPVKLTSESGSHHVTFSSGYKYFINKYSNLNTPAIYTVNQSKNGKPVRTI